MNLQQVVANKIFQIPWGHHRIIIDKCEGDVAKALFYVRKTVENGWSRNVLVCRGKNAPLAKYLLGKIDMPIGVSDYELLRKVPDDFKSQLPTIEEIEAELANMERDGK